MEPAWHLCYHHIFLSGSWGHLVHISRLRLRNFRNFRNTELRFEKGVNTLIGENGSGKTNAFQAIRLLLDDSLSRGAVKLRKLDFNRAIGPWKGHSIIISIDFDELDPSEGCQVIRHKVGHMDTDLRGTYTYFFRPNRGFGTSLHQLAKKRGSVDDLQTLLGEVTIDQYEPMLTGRSNADFLDESTYKSLVGDFEAVTFPDPEQECIDTRRSHGSATSLRGLLHVRQGTAQRSCGT